MPRGNASFGMAKVTISLNTSSHKRFLLSGKVDLFEKKGLPLRSERLSFSQEKHNLYFSAYREISEARHERITSTKGFRKSLAYVSP